MSDTGYMTGTNVINTVTGRTGRVVSYRGDFSEYAVRYPSVTGFDIRWEPAENIDEARKCPELPLRRVKK